MIVLLKCLSVHAKILNIFQGRSSTTNKLQVTHVPVQDHVTAIIPYYVCISKNIDLMHSESSLLKF